MVKLRLEIDRATHEKLIEVALSERRPLDWQAEVILRRALGLPFPYETSFSPQGPSIGQETQVTVPDSEGCHDASY